MPEQWATPEGKGPWLQSWPPPPPIDPDPRLQTHVEAGDSFPVQIGRVECGAWSAVLYMLIGALALAAGLLLGLFVFLRVF